MHSVKSKETICALILLCLVGMACARIDTELEITGKYQRIHRVASLDPAVREAFFKAIMVESERDVADRWERWNPGCVIDSRPSVQFLFGATVDQYTFVVFRHGGFAIIRTILLFELQGERVETVWDLLDEPRGEQIEVLLRRLHDGDPCFVSPPQHAYYAETWDRCRGSASD